MMTGYTVTVLNSAKEAVGELCRDGQGHNPLCVSNAHEVRTFVGSAVDESFAIGSYKKGYEIVSNGSIHPEMQESSEFGYSYVPLGIILQGEVVVMKGKKATKSLREGDFIGLFETSDWILTNKRRQIGDWTLIAHTDVKILYIPSGALLNEDVSAFRSYLTSLARKDHVPQPITNLPLLDWVASHTTQERLSDCAIIAHTHILPNTVPLFRHLSHLVNFGNMYIVEKPYSTVPAAHKELILSGMEVLPVMMEKGVPYEFCVQKSLEILWRKIIEEHKKGSFKNLLILDDGGDIWTSIPWHLLDSIRIVGVEQTQRGITRVEHSSLRLPPIVSVASSGIKKILESKFIGRSVAKKLDEDGYIQNTTQIGVIGMGSIGTAIIDYLEGEARTVLSYDPTRSSDEASLEALLNKSDLIISTTGTDALKGIPFERIAGDKILVSASSADVEFASILKIASPTGTPFENRKIEVHEGLTLNILNVGYPINFDRKANATPDEDIVLTRCLLYIGIMQCASLLREGEVEGGIYNLDPVAQRETLSKWIQDKMVMSQNPGVTQSDIDKIISSSSFQDGRDTLSVWEQ